MKIIALLGPTGIGKSKTALELAKKLNAEIINFDVYQMYQDFNIGVGKLTTAELDGIRHHFFDFLNPKEQYNIYRFQRDCRQLLASNPPFIIMTGGSNLYLNAVIYDYLFSENQADEKLIAEIEKLDNQSLYQELKQIDPESANKIHMNNRQRLMRAIINFRLAGKPLSRNYDNKKLLYDVKLVRLTAERDALYQRAADRFQEMLKAGLVEEVKELTLKYPLTLLPFKAIGYLELANYCQGQITLDEATRLAVTKTRQYIKRQLTWLNNQYENYLEIPVDFSNYQKTAEQILASLKESGWI